MSGCSTCPDIVLGVLSSDVYDTQYRIQRINEIVRIFNRFFQEVSTDILAEIQRLVDMIPDPPYLDLQGLINLLTCPLLPQSVIVEQLDALIYYVEDQLKDTPILARPPLYGPTIAGYTYRHAALVTSLNPQALLRRYAQMAQTMIDQIERLIEEACVALGQITGMQYSTASDAQNANAQEQGLTQPPMVSTTVFGDPPYLSQGLTDAQGNALSSDGLIVDSSRTRSGVTPEGFIRYPQFDKNKQKQFTFSPEASIAFRTARRLIREMMTVLGSADTFVVKLAVTTTSVEMIRVTCPGIYHNTTYPFQDFTKTAAGFTFNGIVPSGFGPQANQIATIMMTLQRKLAEWQAAAFLGLQ